MSDPADDGHGGTKRTSSAHRVRPHRRRKAPDRSPERSRPKETYRASPKEHDGKKRRSLGKPEERGEHSGSHGKDRHEQQDAQRLSLPLRTTRFGNIFGSMRVSDKMHREKAANVLGKKAPAPAHSRQPFRPSVSKLPEQLQRFLQEPSLVSFGNAKETDDLAWLEADSTLDGGVSERIPTTQSRPSPKSPYHPEARRVRVPSPISEHPSQQSTQVQNPRREAAGPRVSHRESHLISRATSPIVTRPLQLLRQSRRPVRDEGMQAEFAASGSGSLGSAALSVDLNLNINDDRADDFDSPSRSNSGRRASTEGDGRQTGLTRPKSWTEKAERVVLDTGEIAYLVKSPVMEMITEQQLSQPLPVLSTPSPQEVKSQRRVSHSSLKKAEPHQSRSRQSRTKPAIDRHGLQTGSPQRHRSALATPSETFLFNPVPVFSDPIPSKNFFRHSGTDKFTVESMRAPADDPFVATFCRSQAPSRLDSGLPPTFAATQVENTSSSKYFSSQLFSKPADDVESILAEYRNAREEMQSRLSAQYPSTFPSNGEPSRAVGGTGSESGRKTSATRVYPRRMF